VVVRGWVKTVRAQKNVAFVQINDGSNQAGVQVTVDDPIQVQG
jgi:asparaginyl-tRNA synthetase